jgi:Fe-S oxidoreductase
MKLTLVQPATGRRPGERSPHPRQLEPLRIAILAGATPKDVRVAFFDDRMEEIDFETPTEAAAIHVETHAAQRAYDIAAQFRKKGAKVLLCGPHATLAAFEAGEHADSVLVGDVEPLWAQALDDLRHNSLQHMYFAPEDAPLNDIRPDRGVFGNRRYLPIALVETGRGCRHACEFCAPSACARKTRRQRPPRDVVAEIRAMRRGSDLHLLVDDNFSAEPDAAQELMKELEGEGVRWISRMSLPAAMDDDFLRLMARSGCVGALVGIESLHRDNLRAMHKKFNASILDEALANLRRHGIAVCGSFVFGYDADGEASFDETLQYALRHKFHTATFRPLTPYPGTPLFRRLEAEGKLTCSKWWLNEKRGYDEPTFRPAGIEAERLTPLCAQAQKRFYTWTNILARAANPANVNTPFKLRKYLQANHRYRADAETGDTYPLDAIMSHSL